MDGPDGTVAHAELDFGHGRLQLSDPNPAFDLVAAPGGTAVSHSTCLYCPDVDAVVARAKERGAVVREEVSTFVTGDRFGSIVDPFGQRWTVMTRVEDVSPEESERRLAAWASRTCSASARGRSAAITMTTASSTIAPPTSCSAENRSPATTTPSRTAITGLT